MRASAASLRPPHRMGSSRWPRRREHAHVAHGIEAPRVRDGLPAPELAQELDALGKSRAALAQRHAARRVLVRELAAHADAEVESAPDHPVEGRHLLCNWDGVAQREQVDGRSEPQPLRARAQQGEEHERIEDRPGERDVVARPERVPALGLRASGDAGGLLGGPGARHEAEAQGGGEREVHALDDRPAGRGRAHYSAAG